MFLSHEGLCTFNDSVKNQNIRHLCSKNPSCSMKYVYMTLSQNMLCIHCMQIHKSFVSLRKCKFVWLFFVKHPLVLFGNHKGLNTISTSNMDCYYKAPCFNQCWSFSGHQNHNRCSIELCYLVLMHKQWQRIVELEIRSIVSLTVTEVNVVTLDLDK